MNAPSLPPVNVPTLTEVVDWTPAVAPFGPGHLEFADEPLLDLSDSVPRQERTQATNTELAPVLKSVDSINEDALTQRILTRVQQQVDLMLEERLPPVMAAVLDRAVGELVAHARSDLAFTLRDVVAQAVRDEVASGRASAESSTTPDGAA